MGKSELKIVYIVLAHKDPDHFNRLIRKIYSNFSSFYIHIDKKADPNPFKEAILDLSSNKIRFIKQFDATWGEIGIIKAEILALQEIIKSGDDFDFVILISGQDYPIKSNEFIYNFFLNNKGRNFLEILPMPFQDRADSGMHRLERYYFKFLGRKYIYPPFKMPRSLKQKILNFLFGVYFSKRKLPKNLQAYGGEHWWCFSKEAVFYIMKYLKEHPEYLEFHRYSLCADEMFFHTIIGNASEKEIKDNIVNDDLRYIDWSEGKDSPKILELSDLDLIRKSSKLFARKFDSNVDSEVLNEIDKIIQ
ncbi:beta-1,6-N-acetylglucosaminyltransferase [soil metagenome]